MPIRDIGSLWPGSFRNRSPLHHAPLSADRVGTRSQASAPRLSDTSEPSSCSTSEIALYPTLLEGLDSRPQRPAAAPVGAGFQPQLQAGESGQDSRRNP